MPQTPEFLVVLPVGVSAGSRELFQGMWWCQWGIQRIPWSDPLPLLGAEAPLRPNTVGPLTPLPPVGPAA